MRAGRVVTLSNPPSRPELAKPVLMLRVCAAVLAVLGILPLANMLGAGTGVPWYRVAVLEWFLRGALVASVAAIVAAASGARIDMWCARVGVLLLRPSARRFGLAAAAVTATVASLLSWYCFNGSPFTSDEMAQQWHARILVSGRFWAVAEPAREFFNTAPVLDRDGKWFSQYPFGGPAFIAPGLLIGAAWLVNPLLLGIATYALYAFLRRAFTEHLARTTILLFGISPMVLIMGASQMNHVPALMLTCIALAALARWDASGARRDAAIVGAAVGILATVRPLDAALVGLVIGVFQLRAAWKTRGRWASLGIQLAVGAVPVTILLLVNAQTTGSPLLFGYDALNGPEHRLGFHIDPNGEMHTPMRGLMYASGYVLRLSRYLLEWPLPGMLLVVLGMLATLHAGRWEVLLASLALAFVAAYAAYWFDGFFSGPRFLFAAVPAFLLFAGRALTSIDRIERQRLRRTALVAVQLCVLLTWAGPDGISSARGRVRLYHDQRTKLKTDVASQIDRAGITNALVFVNEGWRGRLLARLRVLGASQFRAERVVNSVDACALGEALDDAARLPATARSELLELVVRRARAHGNAVLVADLPADQAVAIAPGSRPSSNCLAQLRMDTAGTIPYPPFLPLHHVDADGRLSGDVIFARDLGAANVVLQQRFPGRVWYRYRPPASLNDTTNPFVPIR
ncbi:MAG TPA: hypothetical protein VEB19_19385 [Gemmatimonadaceae bacterium]|nr:hypothetical protein [Gemmatimonadaceae bacterium]